MADPQLMANIAGFQSFVHQLDPRIRLRFTKEHVEGRKYNIIRFTTQFFKNNTNLGEVTTRAVVEYFWVDEIWKLYPTDHVEKSRLIGQAYSPKYEVFWQKRADPEAFKAKRLRQTSAELCSFPRQLSKEELKDKGAILLGNRDWEYFLPDVHLMPLYHVGFLDLAKKIITVNPGKPLGIELMRRLWRLLMREVYDFVDEAAKTEKLEEAKAVTDEEFVEATKPVPENLSKKRGKSSESDRETELSKSESQQLKKTKTVRLAAIERPQNRMGERGKASSLFDDRANSIETYETDPGSSTRPKPSVAITEHQPVSDSDLPAQDPKYLDQTRRIDELEAKLTTAERQVEEHKLAKESADRRWDSQHGQLRAAERDVRELRRVNPNIADYMRARNEADRKLKSRDGILSKAQEKIAGLESELRAEKGRTARLEKSLAKAGVEARDETRKEAGREICRR